MPKIVEEVGVASSSSDTSKTFTSADVEKAMSDAIIQANEEGITDPDEVRERMLAARKALKDRK